MFPDDPDSDSDPDPDYDPDDFNDGWDDGEPSGSCTECGTDLYHGCDEGGLCDQCALLADLDDDNVGEPGEIQ